MLCIWWDQVGVIYCELLKPNETITDERYRTQLMPLSRALCEKRPQYEQRHEKMILQHENAWPHVAKPVKTYLETLKWEVLPHPPLYRLVATSFASPRKSTLRFLGLFLQIASQLCISIIIIIIINYIHILKYFMNNSSKKFFFLYLSEGQKL